MDKASGFGVDSLPPVTAVVTTSLASGFGAAGGGEVRASRVQARDRLLPAPGILCLVCLEFCPVVSYRRIPRPGQPAGCAPAPVCRGLEILSH